MSAEVRVRPGRTARVTCLCSLYQDHPACASFAPEIGPSFSYIALILQYTPRSGLHGGIRGPKLGCLRKPEQIDTSSGKTAIPWHIPTAPSIYSHKTTLDRNEACDLSRGTNDGESPRLSNFHGLILIKRHGLPKN